MTPLSDWLLARADSLRARTYRVDDLRAYSIGELEAAFQQKFPSVVEQSADAVLQTGWRVLNDLLQSKGVAVETEEPMDAGSNR